MTILNWEYLPQIQVARNFRIGMSADEKHLIAQQLHTVLEKYYVHLNLKVSSLAINPLQQCALLKDESTAEYDDLEFFRRVQEIIRSLRDRHTSFRVPSPWKECVAFLPFVAESCWFGAERKLILTKLLANIDDKFFVPGVEITHWNGTPIDRFINQLSWQTDGGNPFARVSLALKSLTVRTLAYMPPPDEDWVTIGFEANGKFRTISFSWRLFMPGPGMVAASTLSSAGTETAAINRGVDSSTLIVNGAVKDLFCGHVSAGPSSLMSKFADWDTVSTKLGKFGYVRLYSFDADDHKAFWQSAIEVLKELPQNGLILDLRGNPGGNILCGQGLVQLLTRKKIVPARVLFRATDSVRKLSANTESLIPWSRSLNLVYETGQNSSQAFSLTNLSEVRDLGYSYPGKVVLIIDSLCYSTTDFVAADFQDNGVGIIIGVDPVTGAGGANVWTQELLQIFSTRAGLKEVALLPRGAELNLSMRQAIRSLRNDGIPMEGLGVRAEVIYQPTLDDLLHENQNLKEFAVQLLVGK